LIGVKEVPIEQLIANKTYFFFSHTFKEQVYNRGLLQSVLEKNIRLIDYEAITNKRGARLIAFGKFAGIVGAHNGVYAYLKSLGRDDLPRMHTFYNYKEAKEFYKTLDFPPMKVVLTGTGRVAGGAAMVLDDMGILKKSPLDFITHSFDKAAYAQLNSFYYVKRKDGLVFDDVTDFYKNPDAYESDFSHFLPVTDLMINGIYWDNKAPAFFKKEEMRSDEFNITTIADVTCDIAPLSSIPSTIRASTIDEPVFGYDPITGKETEPYKKRVINMMTIDNLPNELPRDASDAFGDMFLEYVIPEMQKDKSDVLFRASITTDDGKLNKPFKYLRDFVNG
jgi:alanine dehydrogenase